MKKIILLALLVIVLLFNTGCPNVQVETVSAFPERLFAETQEHIRALSGQARRPASELHLLAYDGNDHELVRLSLPRWLAEELSGNMISGGEHGLERMEHYLDFDLTDLRALWHEGPGLLVQVDDSRDEEHVLLWLE